MLQEDLFEMTQLWFVCVFWPELHLQNFNECVSVVWGKTRWRKTFIIGQNDKKRTRIMQVLLCLEWDRWCSTNCITKKQVIEIKAFTKRHEIMLNFPFQGIFSLAARRAMLKSPKDCKSSSGQIIFPDPDLKKNNKKLLWRVDWNKNEKNTYFYVYFLSSIQLIGCIFYRNTCIDRGRRYKFILSLFLFICLMPNCKDTIVLF